MGETTKIQWTDASYNPWLGCKPVSPGCDNCYAKREMTRYKKDFDTLKRAADGTFYGPLHWKKGRKIFSCSWSDFFIKGADKWRAEAWDIMLQTPQHTYQILTKREQLMGKWAESHPWPDHIWAGVSVENQDFAYRLDALAKVPAKVRFVSCEPLLGPLDLRKWLVCKYRCRDNGPAGGWANVCLWPAELSPDSPGQHPCPNCGGRGGLIHWVIAGFESGRNARPGHPAWVRGLRDQCQEAGVPYFFKQWGEYCPVGRVAGKEIRVPGDPPAFMQKVGTKAAGARLDGQEHQEFPA